MACKVAQDDHQKLVRLLVVNNNTCVRVDIELKFGWVMHIKRISFMSFIRLGGLFNMVLPQICNCS